MLSERTWHHDVGSNYEKIFHEQIIFLGLIRSEPRHRFGTQTIFQSDFAGCFAFRVEPDQSRCFLHLSRCLMRVPYISLIMKTCLRCILFGIITTSMVSQGSVREQETPFGGEISSNLSIFFLWVGKTPPKGWKIDLSEHIQDQHIQNLFYFTKKSIPAHN